VAALDESVESRILVDPEDSNCQSIQAVACAVISDDLELLLVVPSRSPYGHVEGVDSEAAQRWD
jgi:hypothetical protein